MGWSEWRLRPTGSGDLTWNEEWWSRLQGNNVWGGAANALIQRCVEFIGRFLLHNYMSVRRHNAFSQCTCA